LATASEPDTPDEPPATGDVDDAPPPGLCVELLEDVVAVPPDVEEPEEDGGGADECAVDVLGAVLCDADVEADADDDVAEEELLRLLDEPSGAEGCEVCLASTGPVDLLPDAGTVAEPDVPPRGGWLLAGVSPPPPSSTTPPRTSRPTMTAAASSPIR
jgi:hypothetical protein